VQVNGHFAATLDSLGVGAGPLSHIVIFADLLLCCVHLPLVQVNGHFAATLDPLGMDKRPPHPELDPSYYGFTEADLDRE
jgi:2-oxoglutarate dehydrogenase E1 component